MPHGIPLKSFPVCTDFRTNRKYLNNVAQFEGSNINSNLLNIETYYPISVLPLEIFELPTNDCNPELKCAF